MSIIDPVLIGRVRFLASRGYSPEHIAGIVGVSVADVHAVLAQQGAQ